MSHPRIREGAVEDRPYQRVLAERVAHAPHLVVLPTGLGKTVVALRAMLPSLEHDPGGRVLVLAPTKPLADQHARFLRDVLVDVAVACFTGEASPAERDAQWPMARIVVATPQVVQNDLVRGARDLADVSLVVYDEAHRATGDYPYVFIARRYRAAGGRTALGLTASPGNDPLALHTVLRNLHLERVEIRTERDPDVAPYVHDVETEWIRVRQTANAARVTKLLERMYGRCVVSIRRLGYLPNLRGLPTRKDILKLGQRLRAEAAQRIGGRAVYEAVSLQARALKLQHALELAETQSSPSAYRFLQGLQEESATAGGSKASRDLVREPEFLDALALARDDPEPSAKQVRVVQLVRDALAAGARRVLVFANYRETADALVAALGHEPSVRAHRFVGHARAAGERGLTRREQQAIVERFRDGDLNVLVATAVGEEGLDLPATDCVILHEPVPSAIRHVQRRGRTGRHGDGRLVVLLMEGTRDETYQWHAVRRERKMLESLAALKRLAPLEVGAAPRPPPASRPLDAAFAPTVTLDAREAASPLAGALVERGVRLRSARLETGDYAIGDRILIERKSAADFAASVKDGRLADQLPRLAGAPCGVLLVEGDPFGAASGLPPGAVAGALAAATADHHVSVVVVPDAQAAADYVAGLARRQHRAGRDRALRVARVPRAPDAQLRFVLEGVPQVGPVTARQLLERFGSLAAVSEASVEALEQVPGVGRETARAVHETLHRRYAPPSAAPLAAGHDAVPTLQGGDGAAR